MLERISQPLAKEMGLSFLGRVPLDPAGRAAGDDGAPTVLSAPESAAGAALIAVRDAVEERLSALRD